MRVFYPLLYPVLVVAFSRTPGWWAASFDDAIDPYHLPGTGIGAVGRDLGFTSSHIFCSLLCSMSSVAYLTFWAGFICFSSLFASLFRFRFSFLFDHPISFHSAFIPSRCNGRDFHQIPYTTIYLPSLDPWDIIIIRLYIGFPSFSVCLVLSVFHHFPGHVRNPPSLSLSLSPGRMGGKVDFDSPKAINQPTMVTVGRGNIPHLPYTVNQYLPGGGGVQ